MAVIRQSSLAAAEYHREESLRKRFRVFAAVVSVGVAVTLCCGAWMLQAGLAEREERLARAAAEKAAAAARAAYEQELQTAAAARDWVSPVPPLPLGSGGDAIPGATYYFRAVEKDPSSAYEYLAAPAEEILRFDRFVASYLRSNPTPLLTKNLAADSSLDQVSGIFRLWGYIQKTTRGSVDPGTALTTAVALTHWSREYRIPLPLAIGVAQTESRFRPGAKSSAGALGPMQVMWPMHKGLLSTIGVTTAADLHTPDKGIQAGCLLLGRFLVAEKSVTGALKRYYGAFSANYINLVLSHRHSYELYATGAADDWSQTFKTEAVNWSRLSPGGGSSGGGSGGSGGSGGGIIKIRRSSGGSTTTVYGGGEKKGALTPQAAPQGSVVYRGAIRIQYGDGQVRTWSSSEN